MLLATALLVMGNAPALVAVGPPYVVNTTADDDDGSCDSFINNFPLPNDDCTLREAIRETNVASGHDTITFNIVDLFLPGDYNGSWWTIELTGSLPPLTDPLGTTIDGLSQGSLGTINSERPGVAAGNPCGAGLSFPQPTVAIDANKLAVDAMTIAAGSSNNTIIGLSIYNSLDHAIVAESGAGTPLQPNVIDRMFIGVLPDGNDPGLLARNDGFGVEQLSEDGSDLPGYLTVTASYVGYNGLVGINGQRNFSEITAERNEVFENGWGSDSHDGIDINGINSVARCNLAHDNRVLGIPNGGGGNGIEIGSTRGDSNLDNNVVEFNSAYRNVASAGIAIRKGARGNLIQKNVVFENLVGIDVNREGNTPTNRNQIFTNSTFRNTGLGIDLQGAEIITDPTPAFGMPADATTWFIAPDGVTLNDRCDVDGGDDGSPTNNRSNDLQNFPVLTSVTLVDSQLFVAGSLDSTPLRDYVIQFFATPGGEDHEGQYFIGQIVVSTGPAPDCTVPFNHPFVPAGPVADGDIITATATRLFNEPGLIDGEPEDPSAAADWWSTSEYSDGVPANQVVPEGKVTGGGYIRPETPICDDPCVDTPDTRANYGFVAQYKRNGDTPEGHINFVWNPAKLHFSSKDYVALLVNRMPDGNGDALWQGEGKLNNKTGYCFKANVHDRGEPAQTGNPLTTDSFRIKIWKKTDLNCSVEGDPIYDNGSDVAETPVSAGNIQIHHP